MKKIKIDLNNITKEEINIIVAYFKRGKIIVYPTDTIYGLGCLATNKKAINKVYKIKQRNKNKPLLILVSSLSMLNKYCFINKRQYEYLQTIWPSCAKATEGESSYAKAMADKHGNKIKPISVVLKSRNLLPEELTGGKNSVAVRIPKNDFLIKIIKRVGAPIVSTSLNISGRKSLIDTDDIEKYFTAEKSDLVVDASDLKRKPSRLIDVRDVDDIKVLRG